MSDNKCTKEFPKSFCNQTDSNVNGYPRYMRRDNGIHFKKSVNVIDQYNKKIHLNFNLSVLTQQNV